MPNIYDPSNPPSTPPFYTDLIRNGHDMLDVHVLTIVRGVPPLSPTPSSGSPQRGARSSFSSSCWVDKETSSSSTSSSFSSSSSFRNNNSSNNSSNSSSSTSSSSSSHHHHLDRLVWSRPRLSFGNLNDLRPKMHLAAMKALPGRCHRCVGRRIVVDSVALRRR